MISFKVSAPGKVILFGEHAVVYGKTALAASLNLRTNLTFKEIEEKSGVLKLNFDEIKLKISISSIESCINAYKTYSLENKRDNLLKDIHELLSNLGYSRQSSEKLCLEGFFYLLIHIAEKEGIDLKPVEINSTTELSLGSGLGSSASYSVCLSACFFHWSRLQKNIQDNKKTFDASELEIISNYAFECEKIFHGSPSGIDNSICTYGSIIKFRKGEGVSLIPNPMEFNILLVDTKVQRSTKKIIDKTKKLNSMFPTIIDSIMDAIDNIAKEALKILPEDDINETDNESEVKSKEDEKFNQLRTLIDMNQHLLETLQVSHPSFNKICMEAKNYGFGAKLTGAGGGGHALILLLPDTEPDTILGLSKKLFTYGFCVTLTSLGGTGVTIDE